MSYLSDASAHVRFPEFTSAMAACRSSAVQVGAVRLRFLLFDFLALVVPAAAAFWCTGGVTGIAFGADSGWRVRRCAAGVLVSGRCNAARHVTTLSLAWSVPSTRTSTWTLGAGTADVCRKFGRAEKWRGRRGLLLLACLVLVVTGGCIDLEAERELASTTLCREVV